MRDEYDKILRDYIRRADQDYYGGRIREGPRGQLYIQPKVFTEKINYTQRIEEQIRNCQFAWLHRRYGFEMFEASVIMLYRMIPDSWKDEAFEDDMKRAEENTLIIIRGGRRYRMLNYFEIFHAIINLLDRRGVLLTEALSEVI